MTPEELQALEREVAKAKRVAGDWAAKMHDLVEERLPAAYEEIPALAQSTFDACKAWAEVNSKLQQARKSPAT
jgi:hypothetical protein